MLKPDGDSATKSVVPVNCIYNEDHLLWKKSDYAQRFDDNAYLRVAIYGRCR